VNAADAWVAQLHKAPNCHVLLAPFVYVQVRSGPYARYKGRVKQETATHLQLELDAINKIVTVKRQDVLGTPGRGPGMAAAGRGGFMPGRGPLGGFGGFNPAAAAAGGPPRTPAHVMQVGRMCSSSSSSSSSSTCLLLLLACMPGFGYDCDGKVPGNSASRCYNALIPADQSAVWH
jgi:hypothetical protein